MLGRARDTLRTGARRLVRAGVERGLPPNLVGYRWVRREGLDAHLKRRARSGEDTRTVIVHPTAAATNPLPRNVGERKELAPDAGWWGYSMRDVPARVSQPTVLVTLDDARVLPFQDPDRDYFRPAIVTADHRSLEVRETSFRPMHGRLLRRAGPPRRVERATWITERVYDNHSHWLTAHLPKLLLLRDMDLLEDVLLPPVRTAVMDASIRRLGLDPADFRTFEMDRPIHVETLRVLVTDRFRPELLRPVRDAMGPPREPPSRCVYISRARARRRRLVNEDLLWPLLQSRGFERVFMEDLDFDQQVRLMQETRVLVAPHGAGLTNMMFCPEAARVVEIADPEFPNPNFYALACAMGHDYWHLPAEALGDEHPLEKDLRIDVRLVEEVLPSVLEGDGAP